MAAETKPATLGQDLLHQLKNIFSDEGEPSGFRHNPASNLPEEPLVYEIKKKKKKKKKRDSEENDPFEDVDSQEQPVDLSMNGNLDPEVEVKVENIEVEVDFNEFADSHGLMLEGSESDAFLKMELHSDMEAQPEATIESGASDASVFGYITHKNFDNTDILICNICNLVFNSVNRLRMHQKRQHNSFRKSFKFICDICGISYEKKNSLVAHIVRKHGTGASEDDNVERVCEVCSLMFVGSSRLRMHMRRKHNAFADSFKHKCTQCDLSYDKIRSLYVHMRRKHTLQPHTMRLFNCPFCPRLFTVRDTYMKHIKRKHKVSDEINSYPEEFLQNMSLNGEENGELSCNECTLVFSDVNKLKIHMRRKHDAYREFFSYKCNTCNLSYDKMASLKRHIRRKHDRSSYCETCQKQFDTQELYLNHTHESRVFECTLCGMIYSMQRALTKHLKWTHKIDLEIKTLFCDICSEGFSNKRQLRLHIRKVHLEVHYTCLYCNKNFRVKESFRRHILRKHSSGAASMSVHPCNKCQLTFCNEQELCRHIDSTHSKAGVSTDETFVKPEPPATSEHQAAPNFQCPKCTEAFVSWEKLRYHNKRVHCQAEVVKLDIHAETQCQLCGLVLTAAELTKHMKLEHKKIDVPEKLLACQHCDYTTLVKANLTKHALRHSNETPLACDFQGCNFQTHYNSALQNHKLKHLNRVKLQCSQCPYTSANKYTMKYHEEEHVTGRKKYRCEHCDYSTLLPANLAQHRFKHSSEKNFKCDQCPFATKYNTSLRYHIKKKHCDLPAAPDLDINKD